MKRRTRTNETGTTAGSGCRPSSAPACDSSIDSDTGGSGTGGSGTGGSGTGGSPVDSGTTAGSGGRPQTDPVTSLILWALAVGGESAEALPKALGIGQEQLDLLVDEHPEEIRQMQKLRIAAELVDRKMLARLLRVRLATKLLETEDPRQLAALSGAIVKLPPWVFDEVEPQSQSARSGSKSGNGTGGSPVDSSSQSGHHPQTATPLTKAGTIAEAKRLIGDLENGDGLPVR